MGIFYFFLFNPDLLYLHILFSNLLWTKPSVRSRFLTLWIGCWFLLVLLTPFFQEVTAFWFLSFLFSDGFRGCIWWRLNKLLQLCLWELSFQTLRLWLIFFIFKELVFNGLHISRLFELWNCLRLVKGWPHLVESWLYLSCLLDYWKLRAILASKSYVLSNVWTRGSKVLVWFTAHIACADLNLSFWSS